MCLLCPWTQPRSGHDAASAWPGLICPGSRPLMLLLLLSQLSSYLFLQQFLLSSQKIVVVVAAAALPITGRDGNPSNLVISGPWAEIWFSPTHTQTHLLTILAAMLLIFRCLERFSCFRPCHQFAKQSGVCLRYRSSCCC